MPKKIIHTFLLDMDGVLYHGERPLPAALVRTVRFAPGEPWPQGLPWADWDVGDLDELRNILPEQQGFDSSNHRRLTTT